MHLLQGVLALLPLLMPAGALAAEEPLSIYTGSWRGSVKTSPGDCVWQTRAQISEKAGHAGGTFTYTGPCSSNPRTGTFRAKPEGGGCYSVSASIPGLPKFPFLACFDEKGNVSIDSPILKGSLILSEDRRKAALQSSSPLGKAGGTFRKISKTPARPEGKGSTKNAKQEVSAPEVLIGSY